MIGNEHIEKLQHGNAIHEDGDKIGSIGQVYLDDNTGQPAWVTVKTGMFGNSESFIPLENAEMRGEDVVLPYAKEKVKDAPKMDADQHLDVEQERKLYEYYGLDYDGGGPMADSQDRQVADGQRDRDVRRETHIDSDRDVRQETHVDSDSDGGMTLHEEQLHVGTESREAGRVRLSKHVVTEQRTVTVPVQREEVRLEREPISDGETGGEISEDEQVVTLSEEVPVVDKQTVATERVGLQKDVVREEQQVEGEVRREEVGVDHDGDVEPRQKS
ncbi:MAG: PRC and DUF2382 domain-containing protein [Antricoccus sp.]